MKKRAKLVFREKIDRKRSYLDMAIKIAAFQQIFDIYTDCKTFNLIYWEG